MRALRLALAVCLVASLSACGDDDAAPDAAMSVDASIDAGSADAGSAVLPEELPDPLPAAAPEVKVATYNAGLIQTVKFGAERKPLVVEAVKALDVDVVCLQEIWLEYSSGPDMSALLADVYPYTFWTWTGDTPYRNGLLLASKHPLYQGRELFWPGHGAGVDRMAITATVVTEQSSFHVVCTHLEAFEVNLRLEEVLGLDTWIGELGFTTAPTFLLGDFNTGPATGCSYETCVDGGFERASYDKLLETWDDAADGFPAADECTFCQQFAQALALIPNPQNDQDGRIDGCMYRNLGASVPLSTEVVIKDLVSYQAAGATQVTQRSDHRGVRCAFGAPE